MRRPARILTLLVASAVVLAGCGGAKHAPRPETTRTTAAAAPSLSGVPQHGLALGRPDAKVTVVEFIDVQCPFCRKFELGVMPTLLHDYIRTGKIRFEQRTMSFLGEDSVRGAKFLGAAARQNHQFDAAALLFEGQGPENSGWLDDTFLRKVGEQIAGFDTARALRDMRAPSAQAPLGATNSMAQRYGVSATPTVLVGTDIRSLEQVTSPDVGRPKAYTDAIDAVLRGRPARPPLPPAPNAPRPQSRRPGDLKA